MQKVEYQGVTYTLAKMDTKMLGDLMAWIETKRTDPFADVMERLKDLTPDLQKFLLEKAFTAKRQPLTFHSPEAQGIIATPEGIRKHAFIQLSRNHPGLTEDQALDIFIEYVEQEERRKKEEARKQAEEDASHGT